MNYFKRYLSVLTVSCMLMSCTNTSKRAFDTDITQVEIRSYQTRAFDTTDKVMLLRSVIATLQDLEFIIDKADVEFGVISATKLNRYAIRMTITIRPRGKTQLLVRASAHYNLKSIDDPMPYQNFYAALDKSMFLTGHKVD